MAENFIDSSSPSNFGSVSIKPRDGGYPHFIKELLTIQLTDSTVVGHLSHLILLDTNLDEASTALAAKYELYSLRNINVVCENASSISLASGGIQVCEIRDPWNASFAGTGGGADAQNLYKAGRQSGSTMLRPRQSKTFFAEGTGLLWTKRAGDIRNYSGGGLFFIVRQTPDTGDSSIVQITLTADIVFYRPTLSSGTVALSVTTLIKQIDVSGLDVHFSIPFFHNVGLVRVKLLKPIRVLMKVKKGEGILTRKVQIGEFTIKHLDGTTGEGNKYKAVIRTANSNIQEIIAPHAFKDLVAILHYNLRDLDSVSL